MAMCNGLRVISGRSKQAPRATLFFPSTSLDKKELLTMKLATIFALLGSATAFAPAQQQSRSTSLSAWKDETVVGLTAPLGFFDPLGFSKGKDDATMSLYRESELKHGRVAMAACLGWYLNAAGVHPAFNSELSNNPLEAAQQLPAVGWLQFVLGCGAIEWLAEKIKERPGYKAGDLLGAAYWVDDSDDGWVDYQNKEINNGRLAMVAFAGIFVQDLLYGNYGDMIFRK